MKELNVDKVALSVGLFFGGIHLVWSVFVALGWAQTLINFILGLHMLNVPVQVLPFNITTAGLLVLVTFAVGYVAGRVFATVWNVVHKR